MIPLTCPRVFRECSMYHMFPAVFQGAANPADKRATVEFITTYILPNRSTSQKPENMSPALSPQWTTPPSSSCCRWRSSLPLWLKNVWVWASGVWGFGILLDQPPSLGNEGKDPHSSPNTALGHHPYNPFPDRVPKDRSCQTCQGDSGGSTTWECLITLITKP